MSEVTSLLDLLPTIAQVVGVEDSVEDSLPHRLDGVSILSALTGEEAGLKRERTVFHFCDSEIFSMRRQMSDGKIYKIILQEPELTAPHRGGCSGPVR